MFKKYIYLVLVATLLMLNTGCESRGTTTTLESAPDNVLEVYYLENYKSINDRALADFKKEHNEIKVIEKVIKDEEFEDFNLKFKAQLAAGEGADIIFLPIYCLLSTNYMKVEFYVISIL
jgi:ABC-type glycerol-3-phosphate transport system substrate-binding protein